MSSEIRPVPRRLRALVVEDEPNIRELVGLHLGHEGFAVLSVANGDEAIRLAAVEPFDLVVLDLMLPKVDGLEILQKCKSDPRTKHIPIVVLTSSREEQDLARSYDYGVNSYVVKPVDFPQFMDAVRQLGLYWMLLNQVPAELDSISS